MPGKALKSSTDFGILGNIAKLAEVVEECGDYGVHRRVSKRHLLPTANPLLPCRHFSSLPIYSGKFVLNHSAMASSPAFLALLSCITAVDLGDKQLISFSAVVSLMKVAWICVRVPNT